MAESRLPVPRDFSQRAGFVLALAAAAGCGDAPTLPDLTQRGFVMNVSIPGITDTTIYGDSLYWRILHGALEPELKDLTLELLVLNPPPPLLSPLVFELRWLRLGPPLPAEESYSFGLELPDSVIFTAQSNVGAWFSSQGQVRLTSVTDSSMSGRLSAKLVQSYPEQKYLPDVTVDATFWAPHATDF